VPQCIQCGGSGVARQLPDDPHDADSDRRDPPQRPACWVCDGSGSVDTDGDPQW